MDAKFFYRRVLQRVFRNFASLVFSEIFFRVNALCDVAFNSVGLPNESLFPQMSVRYHEVRNLETFLRMYKFTRSASRKIGNKPGVEKGDMGLARPGRNRGIDKQRDLPSPFPVLPLYPPAFFCNSG